MDAANMLIVGANGQLGKALQAYYPGAQAVDSAQLDITSLQAVMDFDWTNITVIINAAAYTNVDGAETSEGRLAAWQVNALGPRNLALIAAAHDITLVHISTDYVFDGTTTNHTEDEPLTPLGVYGQSKAAGDIAVSMLSKYYTLRTTWVIGDGKNFVRTMLSLGERSIAPTVVADQIGRLTFTKDLVTIIDHLLTTRPAYGLYNATNSGEAASWADITRKIFATAGYNLQVTDISTADYYAGKDGIAPRPLQSAMDLATLTASGFSPRDWQDALTEYITEERI